MNLGDKIASNPIVHALGRATGCVDPDTNDLRSESPCAKARNRLNNGENLFTVIYDRIFSPTKGEVMKFRILLEIEAARSSLIDQKKIEDSCGGEVLAINPAPQVPQPRPANATFPQVAPQARA